MQRETWRQKKERRLRELWDVLDIPHIPPAELARFTNETITNLIAFWSQKQIDASREAKFPCSDGRVYQSVSCDYSPPASSARFQNRSQTGGGYVTPRQCIVTSDKS